MKAKGLSAGASVGLILTSVWISLGLLLAIENRIWCEDLNIIGDFSAGWFSPPAFLWLVMGFFRQGDEVRNSTAEMQLMRKQIEKQTEQRTDEIAAREIQTMRREYEELQRNLETELNALFTSFERIIETHSDDELYLGPDGTTWVDKAQNSLTPENAKKFLQRMLNFSLDIERDAGTTLFKIVGNDDLTFAEEVLRQLAHFKEYDDRATELSKKLDRGKWLENKMRWGVDMIPVIAQTFNRSRFSRWT